MSPERSVKDLFGPYRGDLGWAMGFEPTTFGATDRRYRRWFADTRKQGTSIRYVGHFDDVLLEEIRKLNPDLKDPGHLEDGQLIRIPLREATLELIRPSSK